MEINGGRSSWPCDSHGCASPRYILNYNRRRAFPQVLIPRIVHSTPLVAGGPWQTFRQTTAPTPLWPTRRPFFQSNQCSLGTLGLRLATPCRTCTWSRSRGSSQARLKPLAFRTSYLHACELVAFRVCSHLCIRRILPCSTSMYPPSGPLAPAPLSARAPPLSARAEETPFLPAPFPLSPFPPFPPSPLPPSCPPLVGQGRAHEDASKHNTSAYEYAPVQPLPPSCWPCPRRRQTTQTKHVALCVRTCARTSQPLGHT